MTARISLTGRSSLDGVELTDVEIVSDGGHVQLHGCHLTRCDLRGLEGATISGCILDDCLMPPVRYFDLTRP